MTTITQLRDGTTAFDRRLGRIKEHDPLSRNYQLVPRAAVLPKMDKLPSTRTWRCRQYLDQLNEGACVLFAWGHEAAATPGEVTLPISYRFLIDAYHQTQRDDEFPGGSYPGATPRMEGTSVNAGAKEMRRLGFIKGHRWAFSIEETVYGVARRSPTVVGTWWRSGQHSPDSRGRIAYSGEYLGGHAYVIRGVDFSGTKTWLDGDALIRNSWGSPWGINGDAIISIRDLARALDEDGESCFAHRRSTRPQGLVDYGRTARPQQ